LRELVVSCCDPPEILKPSEAALDDVAFFIGLFGMPDALLAIGFARDDRLDSLLSKEGTKRIGVVAPEQSASNALDARRAAEGVGQKFLDSFSVTAEFDYPDIKPLSGTSGASNARPIESPAASAAGDQADAFKSHKVHYGKSDPPHVLVPIQSWSSRDGRGVKGCKPKNALKKAFVQRNSLAMFRLTRFH
jgi:hypothetical protein